MTFQQAPGRDFCAARLALRGWTPTPFRAHGFEFHFEGFALGSDTLNRKSCSSLSRSDPNSPLDIKTLGRFSQTISILMCSRNQNASRNSDTGFHTALNNLPHGQGCVRKCLQENIISNDVICSDTYSPGTSNTPSHHPHITLQQIYRLCYLFDPLLA